MLVDRCIGYTDENENAVLSVDVLLAINVWIFIILYQLDFCAHQYVLGIYIVCMYVHRIHVHTYT